MGYRDYAVAKSRIVDTNGHGDFTTIAAALAASSSGQTIFIMPGSYTENLTLVAGVTLAAYGIEAGNNPSNNVKIVGKLTVSSAGTYQMTGITVQTNSDYAFVVSGAGNIQLYCDRCFINCLNNTGINFTNSNGNSLLSFTNCSFDQGTTGISVYTGTATGAIQFLWCNITNSGTTLTASAIPGGVTINHCQVNGQFSTSSNGAFSINYSIIGTTNTTAFTTSGTATSSIYWCFVSTGTASAVSIGSGTTIDIFHSLFISSNANVITGAGTLIFAALFLSASGIINTTTQQPSRFIDGAFNTVAPAGNYTVLDSDNVVFVDTTSTRTITLPASPLTGEHHTIKDKSGSAATNNITLSGNGNNIDGQSSQTLDANFISVTVVYSGTQWLFI